MSYKERYRSTVVEDKRIIVHRSRRLLKTMTACWIAVWFIFWCRPEGTTDEEMRRARNAVYKNHCTTFGADAIRTACWLLPGILRPLGITLVEMRDTLAVAYLVFETSFDGSKILPVYRGVRRYLFYLF